MPSSSSAPNSLQLAFLGSFVGTCLVLFPLGYYAQRRFAAYLLDQPAPPFLPSLGTMSNLQLDRDSVVAIAASTFAILATALAAYFLRPKGPAAAPKVAEKKAAAVPVSAVLHPTEWREFTLSEKIELSHNTALYRFALPNPTDVLGLPIGQHISVQAEIDGKQVMRSYTPTSSDDDLGHFDLIVKTYPQGNISSYLSKLSIGQNVRVRGPKGQFTYSPTLAHHLGMIAGGTGITPMLQIIRAILKNPADKTQVDLIYANVTADDILLKGEIDELVTQERENGKNRLRVLYVLNSPPEGWEGAVGFVSKQMIEERFPESNKEGKVLLCGPPPMINAMKKHLDELKYPAPRTVSKLVDQVFCF